MKSFVAGADGDANMRTQSLLAMHAKAAILYESATRLASRYNPCKSIRLLSHILQFLIFCETN